ncbi:hypothetical protein EB061_05470 [bacterium]|nr:hypothetical protein [bacterium]
MVAVATGKNEEAAESDCWRVCSARQVMMRAGFHTGRHGDRAVLIMLWRAVQVIAPVAVATGSFQELALW